ncbi:MAG: hypothetical protein CMG00_04270 [Candidatus Marinimicrobia bacterium]|nr:hypothetical protein [Candidatus Neomarinimicrobiota bacterium]
MHEKLQNITAKVVDIDLDNFLRVDYLGNIYTVKLNRFFNQSSYIIKQILNASKTLISVDQISVSLVNVQVKGTCIDFDESLNSYIVIEPDWIINVTSLTQFDFYERSLFNNRFSIRKQNKYMLIGNIIHEVFEDLMQGYSGDKEIFFRNLNKRLIGSLVKRSFDFALLGLDFNEIESITRNHLNAIYLYIKKSKKFIDNKEIFTEHYIIDSHLGMKGKIDAVIMDQKSVLAIELKTGKSWKRKAKTGHAFQAQAYSMLLSNKYKDKEVLSPLIIYSGDCKFYNMKLNSQIDLGMKADFNYAEKSNVINLRNRLISADILFNVDYDNERYKKCDKCFYTSVCDCINNVDLSLSKFNLPPLLINSYHSFSSEEKSFFKLFNTYLTEESSTIKKQIGSFLNNDSCVRIELGRCVQVKEVLFSSKFKIKLKCDNKSDLREKDFCLISDENGPLKGECVQSIISDISEDTIELKISKSLKFIPIWIDAINSEAIFDRNYPSIFNLLNIPHLKRLKEVLINSSVCRDNELIQVENLNSIVELNESQKKAIALALGVQDFLLIQGPPGTGKTLTIAKIVQQMHQKGRKIILSCFTHRSIDELIRKINIHAPEVDFYRIEELHSNKNIDGDSSDESNIRVKVEKIKKIIKKRPVYIGTTYAWLSGKYDDLIGNQLYDVAIMDEASQMIIPNSIGVIRLAESFILVGDHFQQPPVIQSPNAKDLNKTLFQTLFENDKIPSNTKVMLDTQHRMNPVIGNYISRTFYDNELKNNNSVTFSNIYKPVQETSKVGKICDPKNIITLVHCKSDKSNVGSKSVDEEAEVILDVINFLINKGISTNSIGVIAPYRAQVAMIRRKIEMFYSNNHSLIINSKQIVDTIDRFQGDERDIIIFSMCLSDHIKSDLLKDKRKINVALSRAKKKLIVVGDWDLADNHETFKSLLVYVEKNKDTKLVRI